MKSIKESAPTFPRRAFIAAGFSSAFAGLLAGLSIYGAATFAKKEIYQFARGIAFANGEEERLRGHLSQALHDERNYVTIVAHSGTSGDTEANLTLSNGRAEAANAIAIDLGFRQQQITALGVGGGAPLAKESGESDRAYQARLARVEISVQLRK